MWRNLQHNWALFLVIIFAAAICQTSKAASRNAMGYIDVTLPAYGADGNDGNDGNDDITAIQAAILDCQTLVANGENPVLYFPPAENYRISETLEIPGGISVIQRGPILYTGTYNETALRIGTPGIANTRIILEGLYVTREAISDWSSEDCIGIELINLQLSKVQVRRCLYFTIGVRAIGNGRGFGYNVDKMGLLGGNKVAIKLTNVSQGGARLPGAMITSLSTVNFEPISTIQHKIVTGSGSDRLTAATVATTTICSLNRVLNLPEQPPLMKQSLLISSAEMRIALSASGWSQATQSWRDAAMSPATTHLKLPWPLEIANLSL